MNLSNYMEDIPSQKKQVIPHGTFIKTIEGREHQLSYESTEDAAIKEWKNKSPCLARHRKGKLQESTKNLFEMPEKR